MTWSIALGAVALAFVAALVQRGDEGKAQAAVPPPAKTAPADRLNPFAAGPSDSAARVPSPSAALASAPVAASSAPTPPGVTPAQWQALQAEMAQRPNGAAELQRLADYFAYQDTLQRFRTLRASQPDAAALQPMALALQQGLADRLRRNELSADEAQLIELATLQVLQPDDAARQQALQRWRAALPATPRPAADVAREAQFQREQAALVAAWQALPPARRDPALLKQQLQALRERSFPSPGS